MLPSSFPRLLPKGPAPRPYQSSSRLHMGYGKGRGLVSGQEGGKEAAAAGEAPGGVAGAPRHQHCWVASAARVLLPTDMRVCIRTAAFIQQLFCPASVYLPLVSTPLTPQKAEACGPSLPPGHLEMARACPGGRRGPSGRCWRQDALNSGQRPGRTGLSLRTSKGSRGDDQRRQRQQERCACPGHGARGVFPPSDRLLLVAFPADAAAFRGQR